MLRALTCNRAMVMSDAGLKEPKKTLEVEEKIQEVTVSLLLRPLTVNEEQRIVVKPFSPQFFYQYWSTVLEPKCLNCRFLSHLQEM